MLAGSIGLHRIDLHVGGVGPALIDNLTWLRGLGRPATHDKEGYHHDYPGARLPHALNVVTPCRQSRSIRRISVPPARL